MYKFNKTQTNASRNNEQSSIFGLCINCEEFINMDRIDLHTQICTQVSNKILKFEISPLYFEENDFKLKKLKKIFINKQYEQTQRLCRICELVLQINSIGYVEESSLLEFEQELTIMSKEPIQSFNLSLYLERLHSLIIQRINIIQNQLKSKIIKPSQSQQNFYPENSTAFNSKLSKISQSSIKTLSNYNLYNLISNKAEQSEIIVSEHKTNQYQDQITNVNQSSSSNQQQELVFQFIKGDILLNNFRQQSPDKINEHFNPKTFAKRCFYSKVLNQKLQYTSFSPTQKIPVSLLWNLVEQKKIKSENWDVFIKQCLDNPFQFLDPKKFNNTVQNQPIFKQ